MVNSIKTFCSLSPTQENKNSLPEGSEENLSGYLAAARSKARAAGIPDYQDNTQYDIFILALAAMYYDNRSLGFSADSQAAAEQTAWNLINSFVLELRYTGDDPW